MTARNLRSAATASSIRTKLRAWLSIVPLLPGLWLPVPPGLAAELPDNVNVFGPFTAHIQRQIQSDKLFFAEAQTCTEWFYKQLQKKPPKPGVQGVSFRAGLQPGWNALETAECRTRYPGGLDAAREDFSRTQSSLALSLTFYEFALVGDRNDDGHYSAAELQDILESFGLLYETGRPPAVHLAALNAKFDAIRKAGGLDVLMTSMGILYDKGYRFTSRDRAVLNRVSE